MKQTFYIFKYFDKYLLICFYSFFLIHLLRENEQKSHVCVRKTYNTVHKYSNNRLNKSKNRDGIEGRTFSFKL